MNRSLSQSAKAKHRRRVALKRIDRRMVWRQRIWDWFHIDIG